MVGTSRYMRIVGLAEDMKEVVKTDTKNWSFKSEMANDRNKWRRLF